MPLTLPTLDQIRDRLETDLEARLPGADARLRRSVLAELIRTFAGGLWGLYGFLDHIADQLIPDTASAEWLERHADVWGMSRKTATFAGGNVTFTGLENAVIPAAAVLRSASGIEYSTDAAGLITGGTAVVPVVALQPGAAGNLAAGTAMSLISPLSGVNSAAAAAASGLIGGADAETDDALRLRLLQRIANAPAGGAAHDYVRWALEVPGVARAWADPILNGPGTVAVYVAFDDGLIGETPLAEALEPVAAYIDARRPVTAGVIVTTPLSVPIPFTLAVVPDETAVRTAVAAELADLFQRAASPGGVIRLSEIRAAISAAPGEQDYSLTTPNADVVMGPGEIAVLGAITWVGA